MQTLLRVRRVDVFQKLVQFRRTRAGSVTTDWVVLTVAWVLLSVIVFSSAFGGALTLTYSINYNVSGAEPEH